MSQLTFNLVPERKTWTVSELTARIRDLLARFLKRSLPQLKVISQEEVPGFKTVRFTSMVGGRA